MKALGATTTAVLVLLWPVAASAADSASTQGGTTYAGTNGGAVYGEPTITKPPKPKPKPKSVAARPQLAAFSIGPAVITPGQAPDLAFTIKGRAPTIRLRLVVTWPGTTIPARTLDLGRLPANSPQTVSLTALADPALPEGSMSLRIAGRDSLGRILRPGAHLSRVATVQVRAHVFPLRGVFSYGGPDNRFGAQRDGHTPQGLDLLADEGTPVVAPRAGTIIYVGNQPGGAGWYVVESGDNEDLDYAFMHLQEGSITVEKGEHVDQAQRLGSVGHTGDAQGNHLHFEIWQGPWWAGGTAIDPLPYLQQWQQWSPVRAT